MSQLGSRCLANEGNSFDAILQFYYGADIVFTQAAGTCITSSLSDGGTIFEPDGGITGSTGGIPPVRGDEAGVNGVSDDGSTLTESGCSSSPYESDARFGWLGLGVAIALVFRRKNARK